MVEIVGVAPDARQPHRRDCRAGQGRAPAPQPRGVAIDSALHKARPDVTAAAHSHSLYGKAWSRSAGCSIR
ncbi:class II aldolase/adducin family protein [Sphingomonas faeni]|uniref:class II aldolase/adducin family protein n=1 Tax=Sphingomonas faeni TaxID=185950 RepID=UPI0035946131